MDLQEGMKALHAAGRSGEVVELLDAETKKAGEAYRVLREDGTRTDDYKRWTLAVQYMRHRRSVEEQIAQKASTAVRSDRGDAEAVFGVRGLPGDAASLVISRRDAADRVAKVEERTDLRELLARATRSGDEVLARAVAERAVEMQDANTMNQFIADRPDLEAASERLWNAQRAGDASMVMTMRLAGLRPAELSGMDRGSIEYLVDNEPTVPSRNADAWSGLFSR